MKYQSPKRSMESNIAFTCSNHAVSVMLEILDHLKTLSQCGIAREIKIDVNSYFFDGDGRDKVDYVKVNGLSLIEWQEELDRLTKIVIHSGTSNDKSGTPENKE